MLISAEDPYASMEKDQLKSMIHSLLNAEKSVLRTLGFAASFVEESYP
jgi:hypothetical protein